MPIQRGEVYFVDLDPVIGKEMSGGKKRPTVVISINDINRKPLVVTVAPGSRTASNFRNVAKVAPTKSNGLTADTFFQCHQLRSLDHSRFPSSPVGRLTAQEMNAIENAIKFSLGLS